MRSYELLTRQVVERRGWWLDLGKGLRHMEPGQQERHGVLAGSAHTNRARAIAGDNSALAEGDLDEIRLRS